MIRKVAVYTRTYRNTGVKDTEALIRILGLHNLEVWVQEDIIDQLKGAGNKGLHSYPAGTKLPAGIDLLITVGGDGTMLRAIRYITSENIPVIGINTGRMGFLATVHKDKMPAAVQALLDGKYRIVPRSILETRLPGKENPLYALNEMTVSRKNSTSMIQVEASVDGEILNTYWADGLIIATPTGSTGYSLSCNGPIVSPKVPALIITPIAPHSLNVRPLLIPDKSVVSLHVKSRENEFLLSTDSEVISLPVSTAITIKKSDHTVPMIQLYDQSFIHTLKEKLLWGSDTRN